MPKMRPEGASAASTSSKSKRAPRAVKRPLARSWLQILVARRSTSKRPCAQPAAARDRRRGRGRPGDQLEPGRALGLLGELRPARDRHARPDAAQLLHAHDLGRQLDRRGEPLDRPEQRRMIDRLGLDPDPRLERRAARVGSPASTSASALQPGSGSPPGASRRRSGSPARKFETPSSERSSTGSGLPSSSARAPFTSR